MYTNKDFKEYSLFIIIALSAFTLGIGISQVIKRYFLESGNILLHMIITTIIPVISNKIISNVSHKKVFITVFLASSIAGIPTLTIIPLSFLFYMASGELSYGTFLSFISQNIDLINYYSLNNLLIILLLTLLTISIYGFFILILFRILISWKNVENIRYPIISIVLYENKFDEDRNKIFFTRRLIYIIIGMFLASFSIFFKKFNIFIDLWILIVPITTSFSLVFFYLFKNFLILSLKTVINIDIGVLSNSYSIGSEMALVLFLIIILPIWEKLNHYFEEIDIEFILPFGIIFILLLLTSFLFFEFNSIYIFMFLSIISIVSAFLVSRVEGQFMFPLYYDVSSSFPLYYSTSSLFLIKTISSSYPVIIGYPGLVYSFFVFNPAIYLGANYTIILNKSVDAKTNILYYSIIAFFFSLLVNYLLDIPKVNYYMNYPSMIMSKTKSILTTDFNIFYSLVFMFMILLLGFLNITVMQVHSFPSFLDIGAAYFINILNLDFFDFLIIVFISIAKYLLLKKTKNVDFMKDFSRYVLCSYSFVFLLFKVLIF